LLGFLMGCASSGLASRQGNGGMGYFEMEFDLPDEILTPDRVILALIPYSPRAGTTEGFPPELSDFVQKLGDYFQGVRHFELCWPIKTGIAAKDKFALKRVRLKTDDDLGSLQDTLKKFNPISLNGSMAVVEMLKQLPVEQTAESPNRNLVISILYKPREKAKQFSGLIAGRSKPIQVDYASLNKLLKIIEEKKTVLNLVAVDLESSGRELRPLRELAFSSGGAVFLMKAEQLGQRLEEISTAAHVRVLGKIELQADPPIINFLYPFIDPEKKKLRLLGRYSSAGTAEVLLDIPHAGISEKLTIILEADEFEEETAKQWARFRMADLRLKTAMLKDDVFASYELGYLERCLGLNQKAKTNMIPRIPAVKPEFGRGKSSENEDALVEESRSEADLPEIFGFVPDDQLLLYVPNLSTLMRVLDTAYFFVSEPLNALGIIPDIKTIEDRINRQCVLELRRGMGPIYDWVVDEVAICSNEIDFTAGTRVGMIMRVKKPALFCFQMRSFREYARRKHPNLKKENPQICGQPTLYTYTPDNVINSYLTMVEAPSGKGRYAVISNDRELFEKILKTYSSERNSITTDPMFAEINFGKNENGLRGCRIFFSSGFFQHLLDPEQNLAGFRRDQCLSNLDMLSYASLIYRRDHSFIKTLDIDALLKTGCLENTPMCPDGGQYDYNSEKGRWRCTVHDFRGVAGAVLPNASVSAEEEKLLERYKFLRKINILNHIKGVVVALDLDGNIDIRFSVGGMDRRLMKVIQSAAPGKSIPLSKENLQLVFELYDKVQEFLRRFGKIGLGSLGGSDKPDDVVLQFEKFMPRDIFLMKIGEADDVKEFVKTFFEEQSSRRCTRNLLRMELMYGGSHGAALEDLPEADQIRCPDGGEYFVDMESGQLCCTYHGDGSNQLKNVTTSKRGRFDKLLEQIENIEGTLALEETGVRYVGTIDNPKPPREPRGRVHSTVIAKYVQRLKHTHDLEFLLKNYYEKDGYLSELALAGLQRMKRRSVRHLLADFWGTDQKKIKILKALDKLQDGNNIEFIEKKLRKRYRRQPEKIKKQIYDIFPGAVSKGVMK